MSGTAHSPWRSVDPSNVRDFFASIVRIPTDRGAVEKEERRKGWRRGEWVFRALESVEVGHWNLKAKGYFAHTSFVFPPHPSLWLIIAFPSNIRSCVVARARSLTEERPPGLTQ